jgi:hypothetical protein
VQVGVINVGTRSVGDVVGREERGRGTGDRGGSAGKGRAGVERGSYRVVFQCQ